MKKEDLEKLADVCLEFDDLFFAFIEKYGFSTALRAMATSIAVHAVVQDDPKGAFESLAALMRESFESALFVKIRDNIKEDDNGKEAQAEAKKPKVLN